MAKPAAPYDAASLTWSSDTNFSSGDESGLTTKAEPSAGVKAQGHVPGYAFRSAHDNWFKYGVTQWVGYLNGLATDVTFLTELIGNSVFTNGLGADATFRAQLALWAWNWGINQHTFGVAPIATGLKLSSGEVIYTDGSGTAARRSTTIPIPLSSFQLHGALESYTDTAGIVQNAGPDTDTNDYAIARIHPPAGSRVTQVRCLVEHTGGTVSPAGDVAEMSAGHVAPDKVAAYGASTYTSFGTAAAGTSSAFHLLTITVGGGGQEFGAQDELRVSIHAAFSVCATKIHWADYTIDDPGPRNY